MIYTAYAMFRRQESFENLSADQRQQLAAATEKMLAERDDGVQTRGVYLTTVFRADTDLMFWWIASSPEALQARLAATRGSQLGQHFELTWSFIGLHRPAEFHRSHVPAFVEGKEPLRYMCFYPFTRPSEWYLLPPEERRDLLSEHGELARPFPDVQANTTTAFGLGDDEWLLAFESEELDRIVEMIRALRGAEARRYTLRELPFITGVRYPLTEAVDGL